MPIAEIQAPDGRVIELEVPEGATEQQIISFVQSQDLSQFSPQQAQQPDQQQPIDQGMMSRAGDAIADTAMAGLGNIEALGAIASGAVAEPLAGIAGIGAAIMPGGKTGAEAVESARESLTYQPRTEEGQERIGQIGDILAPVGEAFGATEDFLGDAAFKLTGSPAVAAAAKTLPTATLEALGLGLSKRAAAAPLRDPGKPSIKPPSQKQIQTSLVESAPDIETLKNASRGVYDEIEATNAKVRPRQIGRLNQQITDVGRKADEVLNPKAYRASRVISERIQSGQVKTPKDIDTLRQVASDAVDMNSPADQRLALQLIDEIDDFMDKASFVGDKTVGKKYKTARSLWGRARRAELISDAMEKAGRQASGFENGIRIQFRQILNNKKRSKYFTDKELEAMDDVVQGTGKQNILKTVGRLGFSEGQATNVLGGLAGAATGNLFGGPIGAAGTSAVGQWARGKAAKATARQAGLADAVVRAGNNGEAVVEAYLRSVPKKNRSVSQLTDILSNPDIDIDGLLQSGNKLKREAAEIAQGRRAFMQAGAVGTLAPAALIPTDEEQQ